MNNLIRRLAFSLILLFFISGCASASPAVTPTPNAPASTTSDSQTTGKYKVGFTEETCQFNNMPQTGTVQCGTIDVPEDREKPDSKSITLHIAVIKTSSADKKADPVLLLGGTIPLLQYAGGITYMFSGILSQRDIVIMDQRGVGYSQPNLDCPELSELFYSSFSLAPYGKPMTDKTHEAMVNCHNRLIKAGTNLGAYTSEASAADYEDLRVALGYQQWNIYSIGFGGRLAQILMASKPKSVRSVIMDSPVPAGISIFSGAAVYAGQALDWLFESCAADEKCDAAYPDLKKTFFDDVAELNQGPAEVMVHDLQNGQNYTILVDGFRLIDQTLAVLSQADPTTLWTLPRMLAQVSNGKFNDQLATTFSTIGYNEPTSMGAQMMIFCGEDLLSAAQLAKANESADAELAAHFSKVDALNASMCQVWTADVSAAKKTAVGSLSSSVPTLIEQGNLSYNTPLDWGKQIAKNNVLTYLVEFPATGSPVSFSQNWSTCSSSIIAAFLNKPTVQPTTTCTSTKITPAWVTLK